MALANGTPFSDQPLETLWAALPHSRADPRVVEDATQKRTRLRAWLKRKGLSGVVLSRRDNFAWLTAGGDSRVLNSSEVGFGHIVITADRAILLAYSMDASRLFEEQVAGQGYELVALHWHEADPRRRAVELAGKRSAADTSGTDSPDLSSEIAHLHFPLSKLDITRLRWLGRKVGLVLEEVTGQVQPGMTEEEVARDLRVAFASDTIDLDVLMVGSDERVFKYRHPLPTSKAIEKYMLVHPAASRWGLHANVSRSVHFGAPPDMVRRPYQAAATVEARIFGILQPGLKFSDILARQKEWYGELGFPGEWELHFQGGPTGYIVVDTSRCLTDTVVEENQAFEWFITVTGAKVGELSLLTSSGLELPSLGPRWPCLLVETDRGRIMVPDIMVR